MFSLGNIYPMTDTHRLYSTQIQYSSQPACLPLYKTKIQRDWWMERIYKNFLFKTTSSEKGRQWGTGTRKRKIRDRGVELVREERAKHRGRGKTNKTKQKYYLSHPSH